MKTHFKIQSILIIGMLFLFGADSFANWHKTLNKNSFIPQEMNSQDIKSNSVPKEVTKEFLNDLRDENGNKISPENTESDAQTNISNVSVIFMIGEASYDNFGWSVSIADDVNGDGYSDVLVSSPGYNSNRGRAYIFYGGISMDNIADVTMTGETAGDEFGCSVSTAGDVNQDGYSDVVIGAYAYARNNFCRN